MLPDSILFTIRKFREKKQFGIYWGIKFFGLIIAIIIFLYRIINAFVKGI